MTAFDVKYSVFTRHTSNIYCADFTLYAILKQFKLYLTDMQLELSMSSMNSQRFKVNRTCEVTLTAVPFKRLEKNKDSLSNIYSII